MVEQPLLGWAGRISYLSAKAERRQAEIYALDLLWLEAKRHYDGLTKPSDIYYRRNKKDSRSAKQIIMDTLNGIGGE